MFFLIGLFLCFYNSYSQIDNNVLNKSIDNLNCNIVSYSLKYNKEKFNDFTTKCDCNNFPDFKLISKSIPNTETKTKLLSNEIEKLKSKMNWKNSDTDQFINELTIQIFDDQSNVNLALFKKNHKDESGFNDLLLNLSTSTRSIFGVKVETKAILDSSDIEAVKENQVITDEPESLFKGLTFEIDLISFIFSIILFAIVIILYKNNTKPQTSNNRSQVSSKSDNEMTQYNRSYIESLANDIRDLKIKVKNLEYKNIPMEVIVNNPKEVNNEQPITLNEIKSNIFYLSTPNSDGTFNDSSSSQSYKESASIYKFVKTSQNTATFEIDNRESSIKLALQYPDKNIEPVCENLNAFNPKSRKIITDTPGTAQLSDGKWVKIKKAKVIYES